MTKRLSVQSKSQKDPRCMTDEIVSVLKPELLPNSQKFGNFENSSIDQVYKY